MIRRVGVILSLWCGWFAAVHVAWALGWRWGVPDRLPPISERPVFLAYDLLAACSMILLAVLALALARRAVILRANSWALKVLRAGAVVTGVRAVVGAIGDVALALDEQAPTTVTLVADLWFTVAAALMLALLVANHRATAGRARQPSGQGQRGSASASSPWSRQLLGSPLPAGRDL